MSASVMVIFRFFICLFLLALNSSIYALDNDQASSEIITMTGAAYGGDVWILDINYPISKTITYVAGSIANGKNILNAANGFAAQINADPDALQILTALAVDSDEGYSAEVHLQMIEGVDGFDASVSVIGNNDRELSVSITNNLNLDETDSDLDGLTDIEESNLGTSPTDDDTDGDGLKDNIDFDPLGEEYFVDRYFSPLELQNLFTLSDRNTSIVNDYLAIEQGGSTNEILYRIPLSNENGSSLDGYFRVEIEMIEQRNFGSSDKDFLTGISDGENVILFTNNDVSNGGAWIGNDLGASITETSRVGFGYNLEHYSLLFEWIENQAQLTVKEIRNDGEGYIQSRSIGSPGEIDLSKSLDLVLVGNASNEDYRLEGINIIYPDSDMDGLTDIEESDLGTSPTNDDTDRDTLPDGWEVENGRNPLVADYQVSSGRTYSCAIDDTGVVCWGSSGDGETDVPSLSNPTQVSLGYAHSCALDDTGVVCWGWNDHHGQTDVPSLSNPSQVFLGAQHSCALDDTSVVCWGKDWYGETDVPSLSNPTQVSLGSFHTCALDDTGVVCWGHNYYGQTDVPSLSNPTQVFSGNTHNCAIDDEGVVCWGRNTDGETDVPSLSNPSQVSLGDAHSCALDDTGVVCWGLNNYGQTDVPSLSNPTQVSLGYFHSCALDDTGVVCWGRNNYGQTNVPELTFTFDEDDTYADVTSAVLDIDANGSVDALTDGLIILRYLFGLRGQSLIDGVISEDAMRAEAADIETYIETLLP
jgi:alpha-tubulin suppressor-like RCC1 family protein